MRTETLFALLGNRPWLPWKLACTVSFAGPAARAESLTVTRYEQVDFTATVRDDKVRVPRLMRIATLWWGYVTATTVGYGDQYPVTHGGRLVGTVMLTVGVALFATFSGFLANAFLRNNTAPPPAAAEGSVHAALQEVERLLVEQQKATDTLRARIAELEQPERV